MERNGTPRRSGDGERGAAAGPPDPEVSAKATRRRFTAAYKLSLVERADACSTPGDIGRLLRREGLYSSHLSTWRKAARKGSLPGAGEEARAEAEALGRRGRGEAGAEAGAGDRPAARGAAQSAGDHRGAGKSCGAAGREPRGREELLSAVVGLARQVGVTVTAACAALGGRAGHLLPSPEAEDRAAAAPTGSCPGPERSGAQRGDGRALLGALRGPRPRRGVRRRCWTRAGTSARSGRCTVSWLPSGRSGSDATSAATRGVRSRGSWPAGPTRRGRGTSRA